MLKDEFWQFELEWSGRWNFFSLAAFTPARSKLEIISSASGLFSIQAAK